MSSSRAKGLILSAVTTDQQWMVRWLTPLFAGLPPWIPGFSRRPVHGKFVVGKVALWQVPRVTTAPAMLPLNYPRQTASFSRTDFDQHCIRPTTSVQTPSATITNFKSTFLQSQLRNNDQSQLSPPNFPVYLCADRWHWVFRLVRISFSSVYSTA